MRSFLGIARERIYSPGKVEADRAILDAVAERLCRRHPVRVRDAEEALPDPAPGTTVFTMGQGPAALATFRRWQRAGIRVVNTPDAIEGCHRRLMLAAFEREGVHHPESLVVETDRPDRLPAWVEQGAWLKRGDVHATEAGDVVRTHGREAAAAALAELRRRSIASALVQRHVAGDVIKFYAVRSTFFRWFADSSPGIDLDGPTAAALAALAEQGAAALGLEVFGGDCVRDHQERLWLIDLNDWPSYSPCRVAAADAIAAYLESAD